MNPNPISPRAPEEFSPADNFIGVLSHWAEREPEGTAFRFCVPGGGDPEITYRNLQDRVRSLAAILQERNLAGERLLLLFPPGLDFVVAFLATLAAGAVAVPSDLPRRKGKGGRLRGIVVDSGCALLLTVTEVAARFDPGGDLAGEFASIPVLAIDTIGTESAAAWHTPAFKGQTFNKFPLARSPLPLHSADMRTARLLGEGRSFYHVVSRVVDRRRVFEARDKEVFRKILRNQEAFSGVRLVTYCLMSNHFHLLLEVPNRETLPPLDEEGLLAVLPLLYEGHVVEGVKQELERARAAGDERWHGEILSRFERRRGDLGLFLKEVKLRITFYMNKRLGRTGTLWEGRYKSVLVEDCEHALLTISAYIDLNPVRAGIVAKPEDYRWCGYAEAAGAGRGAKQAREGLGLMLGEALDDAAYKHDWRRTAARYRMFLYQEGQEVTADPERGERGRIGFTEAQVETVVTKGGAVPVREVLRHRVRYFCDGAVLGTAEFVNGVFEREQKLRSRFGEKRKTGARRMRGADWGDLRVMRDLQKDVIGT